MAAKSDKHRSSERELFGRFHEASITADRLRIDLGDLMVIMAHNEEAFRSAVDGAYANFVFDVVVNFGIPIERVIKSCHFDEVNENINEKDFPCGIGGKRKLKIQIIPVDRLPVKESTDLHTTDSRAIITGLQEHGMAPAGLRVILAITKRYPKLQLYFSINALGSVLDIPVGCSSRTRKCVPSIYRPRYPRAFQNWERHLGLRPFDTSWLAESKTHDLNECFAVILGESPA